MPGGRLGATKFEYQPTDSSDGFFDDDFDSWNDDDQLDDLLENGELDNTYNMNISAPSSHSYQNSNAIPSHDRMPKRLNRDHYISDDTWRKKAKKIMVIGLVMLGVMMLMGGDDNYYDEGNQVIHGEDYSNVDVNQQQNPEQSPVTSSPIRQHFDLDKVVASETNSPTSTPIDGDIDGANDINGDGEDEMEESSHPSSSPTTKVTEKQTTKVTSSPSSSPTEAATEKVTEKVSQKDNIPDSDLDDAIIDGDESENNDDANTDTDGEDINDVDTDGEDIHDVDVDDKDNTQQQNPPSVSPTVKASEEEADEKDPEEDDALVEKNDEKEDTGDGEDIIDVSSQPSAAPKNKSTEKPTVITETINTNEDKEDDVDNNETTDDAENADNEITDADQKDLDDLDGDLTDEESVEVAESDSVGGNDTEVEISDEESEKQMTNVSKESAKGATKEESNVNETAVNDTDADNDTDGDEVNDDGADINISEQELDEKEALNENSEPLEDQQLDGDNHIRSRT